MHVVIMGSGRVGTELAARLEARRHSVAIIDKNAGAFQRLRPEFHGLKVHGYGFDQRVLHEAGIERAGAFAAVSSGDNSNIVAARLVHETFGVATVVARIYDPRRAEIYQRLGIPTVATVKWTTDQIMHLLLPDEVAPAWKDPTDCLSLVSVVVPPSLAGQPVAQLEDDGHRRAVALERAGRARLLHVAELLQEGDNIHLIADEQGVDELGPLLELARAPRGAQP